jgi:hypothetical protein
MKTYRYELYYVNHKGDVLLDSRHNNEDTANRRLAEIKNSYGFDAEIMDRGENYFKDLFPAKKSPLKTK